MTVSQSPKEANTANVSSVEQSSTTMISWKGRVWSSALWIVSVMRSAQLNEGMTNVNVAVFINIFFC